MFAYYINLILFIISLFLLIYFSYKTKKNYVFIFKTTTSILFVSIGIISYLYSRCDFNYFKLLIAGLSFSLLGDIFLLLKLDTKNGSLNKMFIYGLISFSVTHILYILAFTHIGSFEVIDLFVAIVLAALTITILNRNKHIYFKNMFIPVCIYSFVIYLMAFETFKLAFFYPSGFSTFLTLMGALLFLISDIILSFILFYDNPHKILHGLNLSTYYIGQLLIASSLLFIH